MRKILSAALGAVVALGGAALTGTAAAASPARVARDTLDLGDELKKDQELRSSTGRHRLVMQGDGNLVLYRRDGGRDVARWATGTARPTPGDVAASFGAIETELQVTHGNRVVWREDLIDADVLILQSDGNLVAYTVGCVPVWATNTVDRGAAAPASCR